MKKNTKKIFQIIAVISVCFTMLLNVIMPATVLAASGNIQVSFRAGYQPQQGYVQYSQDGGLNWNTINNANGDTKSIESGNLKIKIVANQGYEVDFTGIVFKEGNNSYELNNQENLGIANALISEQGYSVGNDVTIVDLSNVEFRTQNTSGGNSGDNNQEIAIEFATDAISGNDVTYNVNGQTVTVTVNAPHTITNNQLVIDSSTISSAFTVTGFDSDKMQIQLKASDGFTAKYNVQQDGTLVRDGSGVLPNTLTLEIVQKDNQGGQGGQGNQNQNITINFATNTISGNVVTYDVNGQTVTVTVNNSYTITNNQLVIDSSAISNAFTVTGFDSDKMQIQLKASDGFTAKYNVQQDGTLVRDGSGVLPNTLTLEIVQKGEPGNPGDPGNVQQTITINFVECEINGNVVTYNVNGKIVTVTVNNKYTITNKQLVIDSDEMLSAITVTNFDSDRMKIRLYDDKDSANYFVNEDNTIFRDGEGGLPDTVNFVIEDTTQNVFFVWNNDGRVCVDEIKGLITGGRRGYKINYISASSIVDIYDKKSTLDINKVGDDYFWLWDDKAREIIYDQTLISSWKTFANFMDVDANRRKYTIDPCGAIDGNNTICTNGDRSFRATIYNDAQYEAVSFSSNSGDYKYFPDFWDNTFFSSTVDISGTSKENPADYEAYLLEDTIRFNTEDHSKYSIKSVKALVDNENAVSVKNNNGVFEVTFKSHYYDAVVLELIDTENNHYYLRICRTVMQVHDTFGPGSIEGDIIADVYYDENKSNDDFEVYATINYDDGTQKTVKATATDVIDRFNDTNYGLTGPGGNHLNKSSYKVAATRDMVSIAYTVVYKNDSNDQSYGGTFAGSGKGVTYDIEQRKIIYK